MLDNNMSNSKNSSNKNKNATEDEQISLNSDDDVLSDEIAEELKKDIAKDELDTEVGELESPDEEDIEEPEEDTSNSADKTKDAKTEDTETDKVVEEILAEENGEEDILSEDNNFSSIPPKPESKFSALIKSLWQNPKRRYITLATVLAVGLLLALVPNSRYFILNSLSVRASVEIKVIDRSTMQPLKNATVKAANAEAKTDSDGLAKLENVKLGRTKLIIEKRAFSTQEKTFTVGWGSNPLGEFQVDAIGDQYTFYAIDGLSGQPIVKAEASSGEGNAIAGPDGKMVLTLDVAEMEDSAQLSVDISANNYRTETINITVNNKSEQRVEMVPSRKHVFVSKRTGNYDVYSVDTDGKNERLLVGGSGYERDDLTLVPHPTKNYVAYVATRENTRNQTGYLLSTLYVIDTDSGDAVKIDQSEQVKVIGWSNNDRLVYVKIAAGASGTDSKRHRLMSFNNEDDSDFKELASSNSFNEVILAGDRVYYAPSNIFNETTPSMYSIKPDGSDQKTILDKEVYSVIRTGYDELYLSAGNEWYKYTLGSPMAALDSQPGSKVSRQYMDLLDDKFSLWLDSRDGKGVLINYDKTTKQETVLAERGGLKSPIYWLDKSHVVFRVSDGRETADYIISLDGGEPRKIGDVTDTLGITSMYSY